MPPLPTLLLCCFICKINKRKICKNEDFCFSIHPKFSVELAPKAIFAQGSYDMGGGRVA